MSTVKYSGRSRKTIRWHLPKSVLDMFNDESYLKRGTLIGDKYIIPMYINPSQLTLSYGKIINETLTKGGYSVQYWGEKNLTIAINGSTASSGIEGINVLERVYRNEQYEYENILKNRMKMAQKRISETAIANAADLNSIQKSEQGSLSELVSSYSDGLETIMDVFSGDKGSAPEEFSSFSTFETLGSMATQVEMHFDGVIYQGYFTTFSVTESASEPGHFSYSLSFTALRTEGSRKNFMPWHRSPYRGSEADFNTGSVRQSSTPADDYSDWNLTFSDEDSISYVDIGTIDLGSNSNFTGTPQQPNRAGPFTDIFRPTRR